MRNEPTLSRADLLLEFIWDHAVYVLDRSGHIVSWNPVAEKLTGYTAGEIVGQHFSVLHTPEDRDAGVPERELAAAAAGRYGGKAWRVPNDGPRFLACVVVTPLRDRAGTLVGFVELMRDLTPQKATDDQLRKLRRVAEALSVRDELLFQAKRELHVAVTTLRTHIEAVHDDSHGVGNAKAALLGKLDRATNAMEHVVELANRAAAQLSVLPDPDHRPVRPPAPETD